MFMLKINEVSATLLSLPDVLEALLTPIDDQVLRTRPVEGEWCPLEVIGHLIACDSGAFRDRIHSIVHGNGVIPSFSPWHAINERDFAAEPLGTLLDELRAERQQSAELLTALTADDLAQTGRFIDNDDDFAAGDFVHEWAFHDQDHIQQILAATKLHYLPHLTPVMYAALVPDEAA